MKKHKNDNKIEVFFAGLSSETVTGSQYIITYKDKKVMLDAGLYQCSNPLKEYHINNRNFKFKLKEVTDIVISHLHCDHLQLLPILYNKGCNAKIYIPKNSTEFIKLFLKDSLKIMNKNSEYLSSREKKNFEPLFAEEDNQKVLDNIIEIDFNVKYQINEYMFIRFQPAYHILNSAQIELFIKDKKSNKNFKLYYTGDLGSYNIKKPLLNGFKKVNKCDVAICENTYGMSIDNQVTKKEREKNIKKIKNAVKQIQKTKENCNLIFPSFAQQRLQEILYLLYEIYGQDKNFKTKIVVDTPLGIDVTKLYAKYSNEEDSIIMNNILKWENIIWSYDWEESQEVLKDNKNKLILTCSGFGNNGRILDWFKKELSNEKSIISFIGYSSPDSISGKIRDKEENPIIEIDKKNIDNKCNIVELKSFSSHISHDLMLKRYTEMNCRDIYLVHSEMNKRLQFAKLLKEEYRKKNKTTNVYIGSKDLKVYY